MCFVVLNREMDDHEADTNCHPSDVVLLHEGDTVCFHFLSLKSRVLWSIPVSIFLCLITFSKMVSADRFVADIMYLTPVNYNRDEFVQRR